VVFHWFWRVTLAVFSPNVTVFTLRVGLFLDDNRLDIRGRFLETLSYLKAGERFRKA